jgi:hypothetical protein
LLSAVSERRTAMLDLLFVAITVVFFGVAWAYVRGCERV